MCFRARGERDLLLGAGVAPADSPREKGARVQELQSLSSATKGLSREGPPGSGMEHSLMTQLQQPVRP